jgi:acetylornithine deacetylase/succinyl-diaminopimelate desuccinylase-like protein
MFPEDDDAHDGSWPARPGSGKLLQCGIGGIGGIGGNGAHSPNEDLDVASLERGAIRAAILIYRLTR